MGAPFLTRGGKIENTHLINFSGRGQLAGEHNRARHVMCRGRGKHFCHPYSSLMMVIDVYTSIFKYRFNFCKYLTYNRII